MAKRTTTKSAKQKAAEEKGSLKLTIGEPLVNGEAVAPEEVAQVAETQEKKECPYPMPDFKQIFPGWYRVNNTVISQVNDPSDPKGFKDKVIAEQTKNTYDFLVRFPRFAARKRNLKSVVNMPKGHWDELTEQRARYAYDLDRADLKERLLYMKNELGINIDAFVDVFEN